MVAGGEAILLALMVSFLSVLVHYESLRLVSGLAAWASISQRLKMLLVIVGVLVAHAIEAGLFAGGFWLGAAVLRFGRFVGAPPRDFFEYYYFALETYTTQSVGDLYPVGGLRIMASIEPLVGLILVSWSGSLTFIAMRRYWQMGQA